MLIQNFAVVLLSSQIFALTVPCNEKVQSRAEQERQLEATVVKLPPFQPHIPIPIRPNDDRIIGGVPAKIHEFPYIVSVQVYAGFPKSPRQYCDGTILNEEWILTAGHCCGQPGPSKYSILAGAHDQSNLTGTEQRVNVLKVVRHRQYSGATIDYDIGLIKVYPAFEFNNEVQPVRLATKDSVIIGNAEAAGWGITSNEATATPDILQKITLPLIPHENCSTIYAEVNPITERMLCAGFEENKNVCHGDSGGPLMCSSPEPEQTTFQCGIVSWGVGCAYHGYPGVFTQVSYFSDWIKCKISNSLFCDQRHSRW